MGSFFTRSSGMSQCVVKSRLFLQRDVEFSEQILAASSAGKHRKEQSRIPSILSILQELWWKRSSSECPKSAVLALKFRLALKPRLALKLPSHTGL